MLKGARNLKGFKLYVFELYSKLLKLIYNFLFTNALFFKLFYFVTI